MSGFYDLPQDEAILPVDVVGMDLPLKHLLDEPVHAGRFGGEDFDVLV
jgi:hypothetical protein